MPPPGPPAGIPAGAPAGIPACASGPGTYPIAGAPAAAAPVKFTPRSIRSSRAMRDRSSP